jgi:hypothetical protein
MKYAQSAPLKHDGKSFKLKGSKDFLPGACFEIRQYNPCFHGFSRRALLPVDVLSFIKIFVCLKNRREFLELRTWRPREDSRGRRQLLPPSLIHLRFEPSTADPSDA